MSAGLHGAVARALKLCVCVVLSHFAGEGALAQESLSTAPPPLWILGTSVNQALAGERYVFNAFAVRRDGGPVIFAIQNKPAWATFDSLTGRLEGTPTEADVGTYDDIRVAAFGGSARALLPAFAIRVRSGAAPHAISLSWYPPLENADGSALSDLAGYRIYSGKTKYELSLLTTVGHAGIIRLVIESLEPGSRVFAITAVNSRGAESALSPVASIVLPQR